MPWFHGRLTRQQAKDLLAKSPPGTFLVRFSETNPDNFSLTYVDAGEKASDPPRPKHVLIYNLGQHGYALAPDAPPRDWWVPGAGLFSPCVWLSIRPLLSSSC